MPGTSTLAYYENTEITDRKSFITLDPGDTRGSDTQHNYTQQSQHSASWHAEMMAQGVMSLSIVALSLTLLLYCELTISVIPNDIMVSVF